MFLKKTRRTKKAPPNKNFLTNKEKARTLITRKVQFFCRQYGFDYNRIAIRNQKSRWGSCSSKKNLNFNYRIIYLPDHLADYIVVHEVCHLKEMNHSQRFWALVSKTIPDHKLRRQQLKVFEKENFSKMSLE